MVAEKTWTTAVVTSIADPAEEVRQIELLPARAAASYPVGSHIDVEVLIDDKPARRSYSLVGGDAPAGHWRIAVKHLPHGRGGSRYMWSLRPGARLKVTTPASHFELSRGRPEYLLIAGGIGITPILGMARALAAQSARFRVLYAGRRRALMPFVEELTAAVGDRLSLYCDEEGSFIDLAAETARLVPQAELYICGPIGLMEAAKRIWQHAGRPAQALRLETFGSSGHRPAEPFSATVRDHEDREIAVARDKTLLEALGEAGIEVPWECLRGECGLCLVDVLNVAGDLDHRDIFLSAAEKAKAVRLCACVSRAVGHITIDTGYRPELG